MYENNTHNIAVRTRDHSKHVIFKYPYPANVQKENIKKNKKW